MQLTLGGVLNAEELSQAQTLVSQLSWRDGAETAGEIARAVKNNQQADLSSRVGAKLKALLEKAIQSHPVLNAAARPKRFSSLLVSRTENGGGYGAHIDNALMGRGADRLRTDLSFTLFLTDPDRYEGGELIIDQTGATQTIKAQAGDLFLYPSTTLHAVTPVTQGTRLVCVGWIESLVPDAMEREILYDLDNLRASLKGQMSAQSAELLTLSKVYSNLIRRFTR